MAEFLKIFQFIDKYRYSRIRKINQIAKFVECSIINEFIPICLYERTL